MKFQEIYNLLLAGKKLDIPFESAEDAEYFRIKLAQFKARQDQVALDVGIMAPDERMSMRLRFEVETNKARVEFVEKKLARRYNVVVVEDEDGIGDGS